MNTTTSDLYFGALAVKNGFASSSEIELALEAQKEGPALESKPPHKLGEILVEMGTLTRSQIETVLETQARLRRIEPAPLTAVQFEEIEPTVLVQESGPDLRVNDEILTATRTLKTGDCLKAGDLVLRFSGEPIDVRPKVAPLAADPNTTTTSIPAIVPAAESKPEQKPADLPPATPKISFAERVLPVLRTIDGLIAKIPPASLHTQRKYVLAGAFLGWIALILPWRVAGNGNTVMGIQGPGWLTALLLIVPVGATLFSRSTEPFTKVERIASTAAAGLALLIGLIKLGYPGRGFGLFIGLLATLAVLAAGVFARAGGTGAPGDATTLGAKLWKKLSGFLGNVSGKRAKELNAAIELRDNLLKKLGEAALAAHPTLPEAAAAVQAREALQKAEKEAGDATNVRAKAAQKAADAKSKRALAKLAQKALDAGLPLAGQDATVAELRAAEARIRERS